MNAYIQWSGNPRGFIKTYMCLFHLSLLDVCGFFTLCLQCFQSWIYWLMLLMFFMGLSLLFHRYILGISCFVNLVCVGVRCMHVSFASLLFDVWLEIRMFFVSQVIRVKFQVSIKCYVWMLCILKFYCIWCWKFIRFSFRNLLYNLILEFFCFWYLKSGC